MTQEPFDLLVKERLRRERADRAQFIFMHIPGMNKLYSFTQLSDKAFGLFQEISFPLRACIVEEGFPNDKVFILREGTCGVYVGFKRPNIMGKLLVTKTKVATIIQGEIFGESALFRGGENPEFNGTSEVTIEAESLTCRCFYAKASDFKRSFPKMLEKMMDSYRKKAELITGQAIKAN